MWKMKMPMVKLIGKTGSRPSPGGGGLIRLREWAATIWEKGKNLVHSLRLCIRPRVSLLTGSVRWFLVFSLQIACAVFCLFCLLAAAFTVSFLLASVVNRDLVGKRGLLKGLIAITGSLALLGACAWAG